ncbi:MAG TPA: HAD family acid phosphatase [Rhizomicrobium sp.]|jgi:acid phosphatase
MKPFVHRLVPFFGLFVAALAGLGATATAETATPVAFPNDCTSATEWSEPPATLRRVNAADFSPDEQKRHFSQLLGYYCSGDYMRDITKVIDRSRAYLAGRVRGAHAGEKLAIVLDIDETSLLNEPNLLGGDLRLPPSGENDPCNDPPRGCGYTTWELMGKGEAIKPTLKLFHEAVAHGVSVFFITGRFEDNSAAAAPAMRNSTAMGLHNAGYDGYTCLFLQPHNGKSTWDCKGPKQPAGFGKGYSSTGLYKFAVRQAIADAGYAIVVNVGDQLSDLAASGDVKDIDSGPAEASFLLPNPFY